jgi:hypothetical protein
VNPVRELDAANPHVQFDEREVETGLLFAGTAPPLDSTQSWTDIDLVLRQFGLPIASQWDGGDRYSYCVFHVEKGNDTTLAALGHHLFGPSVNEEEPSLTDLPCLPNRFRLFISHISSYKQQMSELKSHLSTKAIDGFVAHEDPIVALA